MMWEKRQGILSLFIYFFSSSSDGWEKIKLELATLARIFIRIVCRFNSIAFYVNRDVEKAARNLLSKKLYGNLPLSAIGRASALKDVPNKC